MEVSGPGGSTIGLLCIKHGIPLISTITEETLCAVCESADKHRLRELLREAEQLIGFGWGPNRYERINVLRARIREALGEGSDRG